MTSQSLSYSFDAKQIFEEIVSKAFEGI
jgi:hypothetical protein